MTKLIFFGNYNAMKCKFNSLKLPEVPKMDFILMEFLDEDGRPTREEWRKASRHGLRILLEGSGFTPKETLEYNHMGPIEYPEFVMSLSHSKNIGIICLAKKEDFRSIGIDLEFEGREITPKSAKFFMQSGEDDSNLLEAWINKEAAFKAISPLYDDCKLLKQIRYQNQQFYFLTSGPIGEQKITGEAMTFSKTLASNDLMITVSYLKPEKPVSRP